MNYNNYRKKILIMLLSSFLILMTGCVSTIKKYSRPGTDHDRISRIAVLPLQNYTTDEFADEKIGSLLLIDLLSRDKNVIEPGEVMKTLKELRLRPTDALSIRDIQGIGKLLKAEAVMTGAVSAFEVNKGVSVSYPEVSISLSMYEASTGNVLWSVWHTTGGASFWTRHLGAEDATLGDTSRKVVKEAVDSLFR